jgi:hypothetical protein
MRFQRIRRRVAPRNSGKANGVAPNLDIRINDRVNRGVDECHGAGRRAGLANSGEVPFRNHLWSAKPHRRGEKLKGRGRKKLMAKSPCWEFRLRFGLLPLDLRLGFLPE